MHWITNVILLAVVVVAYTLLKRRGQIPPADALQHLRNGALVVDVRSAAEFRAGHLPDTVNMPLEVIETALPDRVKDKNQPILLHCQSGMRSGVAMGKLKAMGFQNVFNLGSYARAAGILSAR